MRAAIYTRVSTGEQVEEGYSLEAQHDILMNIIEKKNLTLYRVYSDPGVSGGTIKKRPGIQAMISDMKAGRFDALLVHKQDRLTRNVGDLIMLIELVNKLDVRLIIPSFGTGSDTMEVDTKSPMGKLFLIIMGAINQMYVDNLREETLKGLVTKMKKGGKHISVTPLGYKFDEKYNLIIDESEAKLIRDVFRLFVEEGWGVNKIAKHMNDYSHTKEGGKWDNKNVRNLLKNPTYAGYNHFKPEHWPEESRILTDGEHEALVSREMFEKAQEYRDRRTNGMMSKRSFDYPYSGIVKCAKCGATYAGNAAVHKDKQYRGYRCLNQYAKGTCDSPSISEAKLHELVFNHVELIADDLQKPIPKKEKPTINIKKEAGISNKRRKNWMMALGDGKLSSEDYANLIEEEDARMRKLYAQTDDEPESTIPLNELLAMMRSIKDNWDFLEVETQKKTIQSMFRKIVINKEKDGWQIVDLLTV